VAENPEKLNELFHKEHAAGLHNPPFPGCPSCAQTQREPLPEPPVLEDPIESTETITPRPERGSLGEAIEKIRRRRRALNADEYVQIAQMPTVDSQPVSPFDGGPMCEYCGGYRFIRKGDVPVGHPEFGSAFPCPRCHVPLLVQKRLDRLFGELGGHLQQHTLENFVADSRPRKAVLGHVQQWLEDPGNPWLYLHGVVGTGKTHLAVGATKKWIEGGHSVAFKVSHSLLDRLRQGYDDKSYEQVMYTLAEVDLLVIDDLGSERHKDGDDDWATEKLFQIIGGRYDNDKRMLITANYSLDALSKRLGSPRVSSRIYERAAPNYILDLSRLPNFRDIIGGLFSRGGSNE